MAFPPDELIELTKHPKVVALGEAGLDYFYDNGSPEAQERGFRAHIAAARATGLPLVIHTRDADDDCRRILEDEMAKGAFRAVLHCYTGGRELAMRAIALGLSISFTGILTFKKSEALRELAAELPADRIMVETDAPYLAPGKFRGKRNEPAYVVEVAKVLAETRGVSLEEISRQTTRKFLPAVQQGAAHGFSELTVATRAFHIASASAMSMSESSPDASGAAATGDVGHECLGLAAESPVAVARQFRAAAAFVDKDPRLLLGEGRRQLDRHDAALEVDLEALPPAAGGLVGEFECAGNAVEIEAERAAAVHRDLLSTSAGEVPSM